MYYSKGDTPAAPILVLPTRDGDPVDLTLYATADAQLVQPDGTVTAAVSATILPEDDPDAPAIEVQLPQLQQAGLVQVSLQLSATGGGQDTFDVEPVVVEDRDGWHTLGSARGEWDGAAAITDPRLYVLLRNARRDCITYKPKAGADGHWPTVDEREAQLVQARNRNVAARIDPAGGTDGVDGYGATVYPLDWVVKALLRPARRLGAIR